MVIKEPDYGRRWYIVQTYSGSENAVRQDLMRRTDSMGMSEFIFDVLVPEETVLEKKADGTDKEKVRQMYPGYVFVEMIVTDESWFVVRNTPNVTGLLGSSGNRTKPVPMDEKEIHLILLKMGIVQKPTFDHLLGKYVEVINGMFLKQRGIVKKVDSDAEILVMDIEIFGRSTSTELSVYDVMEIPT